LLEWIAWDSFELEKVSRVSRCSCFNPCAFYARSYYATFWCDLRKSFDHDINLCLYYACYAQPAFASPWDNTDDVLTLHDSSFPLAQCMGLETGEPFGGVARFSVADVCFKLKDIFDEVHDLAEAPLKGSRDMFTHEESPSLDYNNVFPNPPGHSHVLPICTLPSQSPEYYFDRPINNFLICDANVNFGYENNVFDVLGGDVDDYVS